MIQFLLRQDCAQELLKIGGPGYLYRCSALHLAAKCGHQTICSVLLAAGADPTLLDSNGNTPAQVALGAGHNQVSEELNRMCSFYLNFILFKKFSTIFLFPFADAERQQLLGLSCSKETII